MTSPEIKAIVAMDDDRVIGNNNELPWHLPGDMKRFKELTTGHAVLMGSKTYLSLPKKFRPLKDRLNIVATRDKERFLSELDDDEREQAEKKLLFVQDVKEFLAQQKQGEGRAVGELIWVIGGEQIYRQTLDFIDSIELTRVPGTHQGDAFFPAFEEGFHLKTLEGAEGCTYQRYVRKSQQL